MILTIDGPSGTGKTTIAKEVAKRLGWTYLDTGAMYRACALSLQREKVDPFDPEALTVFLKSFTFSIQGERFLANGKDVTEAIRTPEISSYASQISTIKELRGALVSLQRALAKGMDAVVEGRDMGTVVFPTAEVKIFLTAASEVRAKRRFLELKEKGLLQEGMTFEQVLKDVNERDERDKSRKASPLRQAEDAKLVDTTFLTISQVVEQILSLVN